MQIQTRNRIRFTTGFVFGFLFGFFIFMLFYWHPVIDRFVNWCKYYPHSLEGCRGLEN